MRDYIYPVIIGLVFGLFVCGLIRFIQTQREADQLRGLEAVRRVVMADQLKIRNWKIKEDWSLPETWPLTQARPFGRNRAFYNLEFDGGHLRWWHLEPVLQLHWEEPVIVQGKETRFEGIDLGLSLIFSVDIADPNDRYIDGRVPGILVCGLDDKKISVVKHVHFDFTQAGRDNMKVETVCIGLNQEHMICGSLTGNGHAWFLDVTHNRVYAFKDGEGPGLFDEPVSVDFPISLVDEEVMAYQIDHFWYEPDDSKIYAMTKVHYAYCEDDDSPFFSFAELSTGRWTRIDLGDEQGR